MEKHEFDLDREMEVVLQALRPAEPLDSQTGARERAKFLSGARKIAQGAHPAPGRSPSRPPAARQTPFTPKQRMLALRSLLALVVCLALLLSGAGVTALAAQGSLPGEALYPVKTWSEDASLALAGSPQARLALTLDFTDRRLAEIAQLQAAGIEAPESAELQLQEKLNAALQIAAGMDDEQMTRALSQVRLRAAAQASTMTSLMAGASEQGAMTLARIQSRLMAQVSLAAMGQSDPQSFRRQVRKQLQASAPTAEAAAGQEALAGTAELSGSQPEATPHLSSVTPDPVNSSFGPGPGGPPPTEMPAGYGPGYGAGDEIDTPGEYGPGPNASPTPGAGGPGPGFGQITVTPQGGAQSGPPTQSPGKGGKH
jgi:hypothetical protein